MMLNIHHLELFYYVAKHGGIAGAVRNIPYGIQQPAVSGQIARLEEALDTKLFDRRPFALSPAGKELFEFVRPFFDDVESVAKRIRGASSQLRVAAPSIVLHDYLPPLLQRVRKHFPSFRLRLHEASAPEAERLLRQREIDLAIMILDGGKHGELQTQTLLELPLVLLVRKAHGITKASQLWARDRIEETLITFPRGESVQAQFQDGLDRLGVEWFPGIEVNSTRLIECYVKHGYGIGATVATPNFGAPAGVRMIPLPNFPPVVIGAAWPGALSPIAAQFLKELREEAKTMKQGRRLRAVTKDDS